MLRLEAALDWFFPPKCALCDRIDLPPICPECLGEMRPSPTGLGAVQEDLDWSLTAFEYDGRAAQAVTRLKFERATSLGPAMADLMRPILAASPPFDAVVPVPIHWRRAFVRGFNQSVLLAQAAPRGSVRPGLLVRHRATRPQVELTAEERSINLLGAFRADPAVRGLRIVLVDDVLTTGATARSCASALKAMGAPQVGVVAFCGPLQPARLGLEEGDPEPADG